MSILDELMFTFAGISLLSLFSIKSASNETADFVKIVGKLIFIFFFSAFIITSFIIIWIK